MTSRRVLMVTQHLLGIGHLVRSLRIAAAMEATGFDVTVSIGGMPVPGLVPAGLKIVKLPPLAAGPQGFKALVSATGEAADADYMAARRRLLLDTLAATRPDVLVIEAYPFARRMLRHEMLDLIEKARAAAHRPLIVSSVRDILQTNPDPSRRLETVDVVRRLFDLVLVHGDPAFARLDETFPEADQIADRIVYTGFVAPVRASPREPRWDVVVTAGGGAVGASLLAAAIRAKPVSSQKNATWLIVTGPRMADEPARRIHALAEANHCDVTPFVADLPAVLAGARLVISQAGYNTVADILVAGCRAVVVPFAEGGETEQFERARRLDALSLAVGLLSADQVSAPAMAAAIERASALPAVRDHGLMLDGARRSAELIAGRL